MKISIITIAYNRQDTIQQSIQSVLEQKALKDGTVELEYLVIDGASTDKTIEKVAAYKAAFEALGVKYRIISEPDCGIYDAMNKGIRLATGDVIGILNSDDWYEPNALAQVAETFSATGCDMMFASVRMHKADGSSFVKRSRHRAYKTSRDWNHPTTFVKAELYKKHPFLNRGIHDDYGFYLKMCKLGVKIVVIDCVLANFRMGGTSNRKGLRASVQRICDRYRYCYRANGYSRWYIIECIVMEAAKMILG